MNDIAWIVLAVVAGLIVGWVARSLWAASRPSAAQERRRADEAQADAEAAQARAEAATSRAEAAQARAELARSETSIEKARQDAAEARALAAEYKARLAQVESLVRQVELERDAALDRAQELLGDRQAMLNHYKALSQEALAQQSQAVEATANHRFQATEQLLTPMQSALSELQQRLTTLEKERSAMTAELAGQVRSVRDTGNELRRETAALVTALRKPHVRGAWGEMQLRRVVELAGMVEHCDFIQQATSATDDQVIRPDLRVDLAGGKFVYVDAKVPLAAFLDAEEAPSEIEREQALDRFAKNVRSHIDTLAGKAYHDAAAETPDFTVLFIPSEGLGWAALEQSRDLIEYAAARNIVIATPTTLIALLKTVAHAWRQAALADSAREVSQLGHQLYNRLVTMGGHVDKLGRSLLGSVKAYNETVASLESRVLVTARHFRELGVTDKELAAPVTIELAPKPLTTPELVEDAAQVLPLIGRYPPATSNQEAVAS